MIGKLTGLIDTVGPDGVLIDVGGVGYLVFCSARTQRLLPGAGEAAKLLIETQVREDYIHLYGFVDEAERSAYRMLTTVQGVGSKVALSILGVLSPDQLQQAILAQDRAALSQADGVGPKLASRLVNELRDKLGTLVLASGPSTVAAKSGVALPPAGEGVTADAVSALVNLGYRRLDAFAVVSAAARSLGDGATLDALIKAGLKELAR